MRTLKGTNYELINKSKFTGKSKFNDCFNNLVYIKVKNYDDCSKTYAVAYLFQNPSVKSFGREVMLKTT